MSKTDQWRSKFQRNCGGIEILIDPEKSRNWWRDEALAAATSPVAVAFPKHTEEVSRLLTTAQAMRCPVIPRGAGTGLSGAATVMEPALVLSLEKMNQILEINQDEFYATVEPGVITGDLRRAAEEMGLFYPPIPASVDSCSIGGNVSTNAGGLCAVKYGVTREYVAALEAVLPTGEIMETGGLLAKNSTGYNLTQLLIGSEGTLAVITKITLKLLPYPKERLTLLAPFDELSTVTKAVSEILQSQVIPPTLELIPQAAAKTVLRRHPDLTYPFPEKAAALLIELDGHSAEAIEGPAKILQNILEQHGCQNPVVASSPKQREELWNIRKQIRDSIANAGEYVEADSVVPRSQVTALVEAAHKVSSTTGLPVICYGHAGDGNLHTYFQRGDLKETIWKEKGEKALRLFFEKTIALGGTISGEHGIGYLKKKYLPMALSESEINLMRRLKKAFDPHSILNPGKVFP